MEGGKRRGREERVRGRKGGREEERAGGREEGRKGGGEVSFLPPSFPSLSPSLPPPPVIPALPILLSFTASLFSCYLCVCTRE